MIVFRLLTLSYHSAASHSWYRWPGSQPRESQSERIRNLWILSHHTQPTIDRGVQITEVLLRKKSNRHLKYFPLLLGWVWEWHDHHVTLWKKYFWAFIYICKVNLSQNLPKGMTNFRCSDGQKDSLLDLVQSYILIYRQCRLNLYVCMNVHLCARKLLFLINDKNK